MDLIKEIGNVLKAYSLHDMTSEVGNVPLLKRIKEKIDQQEELVFILPAFPAKSPSPEKTSGELPDFGEVLALQNLNDLCKKLTLLYPIGARVVICSDGRVFSEVVNVSDESIDRYNDGIKSIIEEYGLSSLSVFAMDDLYPSEPPSGLRNILMNFYAMNLDEVKDLVKTDEHYKNLFNGVHRFLFEDAWAMSLDKTKSSVLKETKARAYELIRRSDAWSNLLNEHFRDVLRLSIHPHPLQHEKFGIKLVPSSNKWATPWHNVTVKVKDRFELMHLKEAMQLNAIPKLFGEKYAYFEVAGF